MAKDYVFGKELTKGNYQPLRGLAQKLSFKDFNNATSFGRGIHSRLRRFLTFEEYKKYTRENIVKYSPRRKKRSITVRDVYEKLLEVEKLLKSMSR